MQETQYHLHEKNSSCINGEITSCWYRPLHIQIPDLGRTDRWSLSDEHARESAIFLHHYGHHMDQGFCGLYQKIPPAPEIILESMRSPHVSIQQTTMDCHSIVVCQPRYPGQCTVNLHMLSRTLHGNRCSSILQIKNLCLPIKLYVGRTYSAKGNAGRDTRYCNVDMKRCSKGSSQDYRRKTAHIYIWI